MEPWVMVYIVYDTLVNLILNARISFFVNDTVRQINLLILLSIRKELGKFDGSFKWIEGSSIQYDVTKKSMGDDSGLTKDQTVSTNKLE